jgi:hypothetical protein
MTVFSTEKLKGRNKGNGKGEVHALVIGTGKYPFIEHPKPELPFEFRTLKPLATAPASALAVADWLLDAFDPPHHTRCTVELLVNDPRDPSGDVRYAPPGSKRAPIAVEHPTIGNVKTAFTRWKNLCDASPDNMAIFYVCGHGFWHGNVLALLEDTGATEVQDWFEAAIAFDTFVTNMVQCRAGVQVFVADCCQELASSTKQYIGVTPGNPLIPVFTPVNTKRSGLVVKAAQPGLSAHAPSGYHTAYVTQAVLAALNGRAGEPGPNGWRITCGKMVDAVEKVLMEFKETDPQYCEPRPIGQSRTDLHRLSGPPNVPVRIQCNPTHAIHAADVSLSDSEGKVLYHDQSVADDAWSPGTVRPGKYYAQALFPTSAFRSAQEEVYALPPTGEGWLIVES